MLKCAWSASIDMIQSLGQSRGNHRPHNYNSALHEWSRGHADHGSSLDFGVVSPFRTKHITCSKPGVSMNNTCWQTGLSSGLRSARQSLNLSVQTEPEPEFDPSRL